MAHNDKLDRSPARASDPVQDVEAFAGDADVVVDPPSRGLHINDDGTVTVDFLGYNGSAGATNVTLTVKAGAIYPYCVTKIYDTGTDVSGAI